MNILIVNNTIIPAPKYGGTERVIWWLGKELVKLGHKVTYLVAQGSTCPFAKVIFYNAAVSLNKQIPTEIDVVHLNCGTNELPIKPFIYTMHGNVNMQSQFDKNTVFVSKNHAARFGSNIYVHNGLDPDDYGKPNFTNKKNYIHFLGDAAWRVKNVKGAIHIASKAKIPLKVLGGVRFNFNQGIRLTFNSNTQFYGMVGGSLKNNLLSQSKGMLFPILWNEPFGIAITESLYFGCPIFATPYGSLPEIVNSEVGFLSNKSVELAEAIKNIGKYNPQHCHQYAMEYFASTKMASSYLNLYEKVLNGNTLNETNPCLIEVQREKFLAFE
ncbi:MAG: glycosyltransferase family 4 protein [Chitinophagaceae bacterium]